jgi:xanthine dehydrogenase accessory factor
VLPARELLIVGASPVARALCSLADITGFAVTVAAPKADPEAFPGARRVWEPWPEDPTATGSAAWAVVATQGKQDEQGLRFALASNATRIAFVASARKADKLRAALLEGGAAPERVDAIIAPAGLDIGARTPEEIALAILAQVVRDYRQPGAQLTPARSTGAPVEPLPGEAPGCCGGAGAVP